MFFIDASGRFEKRGKVSVIPPEDVAEIVRVYQERREVPKFTHAAPKTELEYNEYNLNISRYVDTYEPPPEIDIVEVTQKIAEYNTEIRRLDRELLTMLKEMKGTSPAKDRELKKAVEIWEGMINGYAQIALPTDDAP